MLDRTTNICPGNDRRLSRGDYGGTGRGQLVRLTYIGRGAAQWLGRTAEQCDQGKIRDDPPGGGRLAGDAICSGDGYIIARWPVESSESEDENWDAIQDSRSPPRRLEFLRIFIPHYRRTMNHLLASVKSPNLGEVCAAFFTIMIKGLTHPTDSGGMHD